MTITKDQMARDLVDKTGYYLKDVRCLLSAMDDLFEEYMSRVTDEEEVSVQLIRGLKAGCKIVPERERKNPKTGEPCVCKSTAKPFAKFSVVFRGTIQKQYDDKKQEDA